MLRNYSAAGSLSLINALILSCFSPTSNQSPVPSNRSTVSLACVAAIADPTSVTTTLDRLKDLNE